MGVLLIWAVGLSISLFPHLTSSFCYGTSLGELSTPENIKIFFVGENMTVFCHKYSDFTGKASFMFGNDDYLPEEFVKQLNTTHAQLVKPVLPVDPESFVVQCFDNGSYIDSNLLTLQTDYAPGYAKNLNVEWIDMKSLNFRFDFGGIPYKNNRSDVQIITAEYSSNISTGWLPCPNNVSLDSTLTCYVASFTPFMETMFYVRVNATNGLRGKTVSTVLGDKAVKEYAKPSPVLVEKIVTLNSSSVKLSVSFEVASDRDRFSYIITYYRDTQSDPVNKIELETGQTSDKIFTISHLHPAYTYKFEVKAKFDTGNPSYIGPKSVGIVIMPENAPGAGPQIHPSAFSLQQIPCVNQSAVYIYYQAVADECKNGEIMNYTASLSTVSLQTFVQSKPDIHTLKLENVPCNESSEVKVRAANNAGSSPHTSLILPPYSSVQPLLTEVTERDLKIQYDPDSKTVTALWDLRSADLKLVVYYCDQYGNDPAQCKGNIHFIEIEPGENISRMLLPNATVDMKFGMAVLSPEPSGIVFTECIYDTSVKLPNLGEAKLQAISLDNYISLTWLWQRCNRIRRTMILEYELEICRMPGTKDCSTHMVDGHATEYTVVKAVRNTNYSVRIRANTTSTDIWTPYSDYVYTSLPSTRGLAGLNGGEIAGIILAVLLGAFFLGTTLACILRYKFKQNSAKFSRTIVNKSDFNTLNENKAENYAEVNNDQSSPSATDTISTKDNAKLLSLDSVLHRMSGVEDAKGYDSIMEPAEPTLPPDYIRVVADHPASVAGTQHISVNVEIIVGHAQPSHCNASANGVLMAAAAPDSAESLVMESSSTASCLQDMSTSADKDSDVSSSASNNHWLPGYVQVTGSSPVESDFGSSSSDFEAVHGEPPYHRYISNPRCYSPESTEEGAEISSNGSVEDASMDSIPEEPEQKSQHPAQPVGYVTYDMAMHLNDKDGPEPLLDRFARENAEPAIELHLDEDQCSSQSVPNHLIPTSGDYISYPLSPSALVPSDAVYLEKSSLPGLPYHEAKASFQGKDFVAELSEKHQDTDSGPVNPVTGSSDSAASHGFVHLHEATLENVGPFSSAERDVDQYSICSSKSNDSSAGISLGSFAGMETSYSDAGSNRDPGDHNVDPLALDRQDSGYISPHPASESPWDSVRLQTLTSASYPTYSVAATPTESTGPGKSGGYIGFNDLPPSIAHTLGDSQSIA